MRHVRDQGMLALQPARDLDGGRVEHIGDPVEFGNAVPARIGPEVALGQPCGPCRHVAQRIGHPAREGLVLSRVERGDGGEVRPSEPYAAALAAAWQFGR